MSNWFPLNKSLIPFNKFQLLNEFQFVKQILAVNRIRTSFFSPSEFVRHALRSILQRTYDCSWRIPWKNIVLRKEIKLKFVWFPCAEQCFCMESIGNWNIGFHLIPIQLTMLFYDIIQTPLPAKSRSAFPSIRLSISVIRDRSKAWFPVPDRQTNA